MAFPVPRLPRSRRGWALAVAAGLASLALWYFAAYPRGMLMAYLHHACGHYEAKTYGYPAPWGDEYGRLLEEKYGVEPNVVGGCCVSEPLAWYVRGYNAVSTRQLRDKYGSDIFEECASLAKRQWRAGHPDW